MVKCRGVRENFSAWKFRQEMRDHTIYPAKMKVLISRKENNILISPEKWSCSIYRKGIVTNFICHI